MTDIVQMVGASKSFGDKQVLSATNLNVAAGEVVGVIGPNGGGKSTLLMLMAGLLQPSGGTVQVCGKPAHRLALESAGKVGLVMARPGLYPLLTGWENLNYFGGLFGLNDSAIRDKSAEMLRRFNLTDDMSRRLSTWSTGMQQKLSLVRALLLSPELLLFDEPAANLDPLAAEVLYGEVRRRADEGLACILVTHDLDAADALCDRVLLVNRGVHEELPTTVVSERPKSALLEAWRAMENA